MKHESYEIMSYEHNPVKGKGYVECTILVLQDGVPKAIYQVPSHGFKLPEDYPMEEESEVVIDPKLHSTYP